MEVAHGNVVLIDLFGIVAMRDEEDVSLQILLDHEPRTATESQSFALTDGVEPEATVYADFVACFYLAHIAGLFAQMSFDVVAKVDVTQKADALRVFALGI